jgi:hypothetical protein
VALYAPGGTDKDHEYTDFRVRHSGGLRLGVAVRELSEELDSFNGLFLPIRLAPLKTAERKSECGSTGAEADSKRVFGVLQRLPGFWYS